MTILFLILLIIVLLVIGGWVIGAIWTLLGLLFTGLIIGALARLLVKGTHGLGFLRTMLAGVVGSLGGGILAHAFDQHGFVEFLIAILVAAVVIAVMVGAIGSRGRRSAGRAR